MSLSRVLSVRIGLRSAGVRSGAPRTRAALLLSLAAAMLGGCSTTAPSPTGGLFGGLIATMAEPDRKPPQPAGEIEDDGMEGAASPAPAHVRARGRSHAAVQPQLRLGADARRRTTTPRIPPRRLEHKYFRRVCDPIYWWCRCGSCA